MQGNRGGRDPFFGFGDPFAGFGGLGGQRSLISEFLGGRDPFDDPFFTRPMGMFNSSFFGPMGSPFMDMHPSMLVENEAPQPKRSRGPIIEELDSGDEKEEDDAEQKKNPRKLGRSNTGPRVDFPDEGGDVNRELQNGSSYRGMARERQLQPQGHSYTFHSSSVTYGGADGAYYTSSTTRRAGSDGVTFEERKEADSSTMQASHRVSRGLHNKGHSVTRKLKSDGRVDTSQTLHNLEENDLTQFEQAWKGSAARHLPGWSEHADGYNRLGAGSTMQNGEVSRGGWALPSTEHPQVDRRAMPDIREVPGSSHQQQSGRVAMGAKPRGGHRVKAKHREA